MRNDTAVALRDKASRRVRRLTALAIAGATALTAAFSGLAAGSTHTGKHNTAKTTKTTAKRVTAPTPSLTPAQSAAPPPSPTVTPSSQQPVVVSGGS